MCSFLLISRTCKNIPRQAAPRITPKWPPAWSLAVLPVRCHSKNVIFPSSDFQNHGIHCSNSTLRGLLFRSQTILLIFCCPPSRLHSTSITFVSFTLFPSHLWFLLERLHFQRVFGLIYFHPQLQHSPKICFYIHPFLLRLLSFFSVQLIPLLNPTHEPYGAVVQV